MPRRHETLASLFNDIADAIRSKGVGSVDGDLKADDFDTSISNIFTPGPGTHSGTVSTHNISTTPVVTPSIGGTVTDISSTSQPSGTNGTDYWTLDPGGSVTTTGVSSAKATATIGTAGYISTSSSESAAHTVNITPTVAAGTNRYISKATSSKTNPTASATNGTASVTKNPSASASVTATGFTPLASGTSAYYVTASASSASGTISATGGSASTTAGSVTVGAGYNPSSVTASVAASSASGTSASTTEKTASDSKTIYIPAGSHSGTVSTHSISTTPVVTPSIGGTVTDISSTSQPSGTNGTDYWTLDPGGSVTTTGVSSAKATATIGTAGYIASSSGESSAHTVNITPTVAAGTNRYITAGSLSAGNGAITLTPGAGSASATGTNITLGTATTTQPSSGGYIKVTGSGTVSGTGSGTVNVGTSGYIPNTVSKTSNTASSSASSNTATVYYPISGKAATTYHPSDEDQVIAAGQYLSGAQTIKAVIGTNIGSANIKAGVTIKIGDIDDDDSVASVTGTFTSDADAIASDILSGKTAYVNGSKITGTLSDIASTSVSNVFNAYQEFTANSPVSSSTSVASAPTAGSIRVTGGIASTSGIKGYQVYNAVWNDLADTIQVDDECELEFGKCYCFDGEHYYKSQKYLDDGIIGIHSDTAGFVMGTKGIGKEMQVAVAGFVLAYVDKEYPVGTLLTCTENGYLTQISKEDKIENPEKIVASFWKPEIKETWGSEDKHILVNGRMWVKIR